MTVISAQRGRVGTERLFFLMMALVIAATVVFGFSVSIARPEVGFTAAPPQVYVHGAVFSLWIVFFVLQNTLVVAGAVGWHRRLGWMGASLAILMVGLGVTTTVMALQQHRVPPIFPPSVFLMVDVAGVVTFGGLTAAAVAMRGKPAWHRRLMLCGTIMVMSPALGRVLPMAALGPLATWAVSVSMVVYVGTGVAFDRVALGRVHPAYFWGMGAIALNQGLIGALSFSPPILSLTARLMG